MSKIDVYAEALRSKPDWIAYLRKESGLPGPRGNLELAQAVARVGDRSRFEELLKAESAAQNTPDEFVFFCGVLGLGKLAADGDKTQLPRLRAIAGDERWRIREAVAMALQLIGDVDLALAQREAATLSKAGWLEKRAAAAALAEPRLLRDAAAARKALSVLDDITASMTEANADERRSEAFKVLRKGMGYCWSVVVAALPKEGKRAMERWLKSDDPDVRWVVRENLKKNRLIKADPDWVSAWEGKLGHAAKKRA
jgi:hypothetical protein